MFQKVRDRVKKFVTWTQAGFICDHPECVDNSILPTVKQYDHIVARKTSVIYMGSLFTEENNTLDAVKHRVCCTEPVVKLLMPRVCSRRSVDSILKG